MEQDYNKAKYYFEQAAEQGHVKAQYNLGVLHHNGRGVEQDFEKAKCYYELAAGQGDARVHMPILVISITMEWA